MTGYVDLGPDGTGFTANFAFGWLRLGEGSLVRRVEIVDALDKLPKLEVLFARELVLGPASCLNLDGKTLYCGASTTTTARSPLSGNQPGIAGPHRRPPKVSPDR